MMILTFIPGANMKKYSLLFAVALLAAACSTKIEQGVSFPVFHASIEGNDNTKLYAGEDLNIYWNAQDAISLFNKSDANSKATFTGADGASSGDFQVTSAGSGSTALDYVYAVYPYNEAYAVSSSGISLTFPTVQSYGGNSFGPDSNIMVSVSEDENLFFRNVGGYIHLKLYGEDISVAKLEIDSNNKEPLSGTGTVTMAPGGEPSIRFTRTGAKDYVYVDMSYAPVKLGSTPDTATDFWISVAPVSFKAGFTLYVVTDAGKEIAIEMNSALTIPRNTRINMAPAKVEYVPASEDAIDALLSGNYIIHSSSLFESEGYGPYDDVVTFGPSDEPNFGSVMMGGYLAGEQMISNLYGDLNADSGAVNFPAGQVVDGFYADDKQSSIVWLCLYMGAYNSSTDRFSYYSDDILFALTAPHDLHYYYGEQYGLGLIFIGYVDDNEDPDGVYEYITVNSIEYVASSSIAARAAASGYNVKNGVKGFFTPQYDRILGLKLVGEAPATAAHRR